MDAAFEVHGKPGPGLLESVYETCLCHELARLGAAFRRQLVLPIKYDDIQLDGGLRLDVVVNSSVIAEIKAVESVLPVHEAQLLTYVKLARMR